MPIKGTHSLSIQWVNSGKFGAVFSKDVYTRNLQQSGRECAGSPILYRIFKIGDFSSRLGYFCKKFGDNSNFKSNSSVVLLRPPPPPKKKQNQPAPLKNLVLPPCGITFSQDFFFAAFRWSFLVGSIFSKFIGSIRFVALYCLWSQSHACKFGGVLQCSVSHYMVPCTRVAYNRLQNRIRRSVKHPNMLGNY